MSQSANVVSEKLRGSELSAVTFVRDYLQLQFDGPILNAVVWPRIKNGDVIVNFEMSGYRDALCRQIGKMVLKVEETDDMLSFLFADGSFIEFSLQLPACRGQEAVLLEMRNGPIYVW